LPEDVDFNVTGNPILTSKSFSKTACPKCGSDARRETDTMGGFMDSSWYFLRYCSPESTDKAFDDSANYWMPVDQYVGGIEHAVGHLIYSRFFTKVLRDMGMLNFDEPFSNLFNQGVVYKDGKRMSKSQGNTVTQEEVEKKYGIDTARLYMLFLASPEKDLEWNDQGIEGAYKFLIKLHKLVEENVEGSINSFSNHKDKFLKNKINSTVIKITSDIEQFKMNNAIISLMEFVNYINDNKGVVSGEVLKESLETTSLLLNPFAPHVSEECWSILGHDTFSSLYSWPVASDVDLELEFLEDNFTNTVKDIYNVLGLAKIQKPKDITLIISETWKYEFLQRIKHIVEVDLLRNTGDVMKAIMSTDLKKHGSEITKLVPKIMMKLPSMVISRDKELEFLKQSIGELEKNFSCDIKIVLAEESQEQKAKQAMPGKPAIIVK
jgi:leucyl-tRNA synthetase